jgi:hypothetical protein
MAGKTIDRLRKTMLAAGWAAAATTTTVQGEWLGLTTIAKGP